MLVIIEGTVQFFGQFLIANCTDKTGHNKMNNTKIRSHLRVSWVITGVLFFLLLVGIAYAINQPVVHSSTYINTGFSQIPANLKRPLQLSQTVEGIILTLNWAYADESTIIVAYTVHNDEYELKKVELINQDGVNFLPIVGTGDVVPTLLKGDEYVFSFDTSMMPDGLSELDLHLQIELESRQKKEIVGPFTFSFMLPRNFSYSVEPKDITTASGISITLETVLITPSDMIATICFEEPVDSYDNWLPISFIDVETSNTIEKSRAFNQTSLDQDGCTKSHYFPTLYNYSGNWELTITELVGFKMDAESPEQLRLEGPWIFEFNLP